MSRSLPPRPSLEHLRKEAKAVLAAQKAGRMDGCRQLRLLGRLADLPDDKLLAAKVSLQDVQMALALDYGFPHWAALRQHVESVRGAQADAPPPAEPPKGEHVIGKVAPVTWPEFPHSLVSALRQIGKDVSVAYVAGASGMAFRYVHGPADPTTRRMRMGYELANFMENPESPVDWAFDAVGYEYTNHPRGHEHVETQRLVRLLDAGRPILFCGGWDHSDYSVVYGYADEGKTLLGQSAFLRDYRLPNWHSGHDDGWQFYRGMIEIGPPKTPLPPLAVLKRSMALAVSHMRGRMLRGQYLGVGAYEVRSREMRNPRLFPTDDPGLMEWQYLCIHCVNMMITERGLAAEFVASFADELPSHRASLTAIAGHFRTVQQLGDKMSQRLPWSDDPAVRARLFDDTFRDEYADIILAIREAEEQAVVAMERLLPQL